MKKRTMLATGGIMTSLLLASASPALAQSIRDSHASQSGATHLVEPDASPVVNASQLGIGADDELYDPESKRVSKQILMEEGFNASQIQKILIGADEVQSYRKNKGMNADK